MKKPLVAVAVAASLTAAALAQQSQPTPQAKPQPPGALGSSATPPAPPTGVASQPTQGQQGQQGGAQQPPRRSPIVIAPPTVREVVDATVKDAADTILSPSDVGRIKDSVMRSRERQTSPTYPGNTLPKPISRAVMLEADPAQQPLMVRMSSATITSFVFSDVAGNPWIIDSASFDPATFSDGNTGCTGGGQQQQDNNRPRKQTNILNLQPCDAYAFGNVILQLKGFPAPVIFMLATGKSNEVDVRISARVKGLNPDAKAEIVQTQGLPEHDAAMQDFLDGAAPPSAVPLKLAAGVGQAWLYAGAMYVRSRHQVYAPAFHAHVGSADGVHVYKFRRPEPMLTISNAGRPDTISIAGF